MLLEFYGVIKAIHIVAIISWMAALFYLPRLFVYHMQNIKVDEFVRVVRIQQKKLYVAIAYPALFLSIISGILLIASMPEIMKNGFMHAKILFVLILVAFHFACGFYIKKLSCGPARSEKFFRFFNEIPTICLIAIVFLVVLRPF